MGNIFRQANQVVVWLGDAQDITEAAINPLSSENATETLSNSVQRVFFTLLSKSYWTRVWIIQELAEASKITVLCGHYNLLWEGLESFSRSTFTPSFDGADGGELKAKFQELLQFRIDRLSIKPVSLLELLYRSRSACSTDPRDKIYGLLGLAYDSHVYVPEPNYNLSVEETYTKFSRTFIEKGYPLDLIYLRSSRRGIHESLPSWVVDWQDLNDALAKQEFEHILASVRRSTQSFPPTLSSQPSFSSYNLTVSGAILRTIDGVGSALSADGSHFTASGKTAKNRSSSVPADYDHSTYIFNALLETQKQPSATTNPPPNPIGLWSCEPAKLEKYLCGPVEPRLEALSKWIDANSSFTALGKTMKIWDNIWTSQQVSTDRDSRRDNTGHDIDLCGLAATILSGMRIATLETGELGWVHPQSQEGDKISKIFGCSRYVVLRPVVKGFRVIGEARVSWFAGKPELSKRENLILT
ncbi:hypothetical protein FQN54_003332 [Arachnomyces sp. PD_36]|nr:hypothetical protein FQN54_003332 [Arachnomyces sp. PD_36]